MLPMTPCVQKLLIANITMFFLAPFSPVELSFYPPAILVQPWTLVSYMFLHSGFMHLFFNMIG